MREAPVLHAVRGIEPRGQEREGVDFPCLLSLCKAFLGASFPWIPFGNICFECNGSPICSDGLNGLGGTPVGSGRDRPS